MEAAPWHLEHCSSGGASALPHARLSHVAPPAAAVAAAAAALNIASQGLCASALSPLGDTAVKLWSVVVAKVIPHLSN